MRYNLTSDEQRRLRTRLASIPEIREDEVEQMLAFAASIVGGRFEAPEVPRTAYERRFDK